MSAAIAPIVKFVVVTFTGDVKKTQASSCELLRLASGKTLTGISAYALYFLLGIGTLGAVKIPYVHDLTVTVEETKEIGECVFRVRTPWGEVYVVADPNDGKDLMAPWKIEILV